jgi:uncharacterized protein with beta-barrel porin domain
MGLNAFRQIKNPYFKGRIPDMKLNMLKLLFIAALVSSSALSAFASDITLEDGTPLTIGVDIPTTNGATLFVGAEQSGNTLIVTNGGEVVVNTIHIGRYKGSDNNILKATGSNSIVRAASDVNIGQSGAENQLIIEDNAQMLIGVDAIDPAYGAAIAIGNTNGTAKLSINNGSIVYTDNLIAGSRTNDSGKITLNGNSSELNINNNAYIGLAGSGNLITISGGTMTVSNLLQIGSADGSNNVLRINQNGTVIIAGSATNINSDAGNQLHLNGGSLTYVGNAELAKADERGFIIESGSTLEIGGTLTFGEINEGFEIILNNSLSTNTATWDTGTNAMVVGNTSSGNILTLKDGATAVSGSGTAKIGEKSNNNKINVAGAGSKLQVNGAMRIGQEGSLNELNITDEATASITEDLIIGRDGNQNSSRVSGTNSSLKVGTDLTIGLYGNNNSVWVEDGADLIVTNSLRLGEESGSNLNSFDLADSTATILGDLLIGSYGMENSVSIAGSNSLATVDGDLFIGQNGNDNLLRIESGADLVLTGNAYMGTNSANNTIEVTGSNSLFDITGDLLIGNILEDSAASNNTLSVIHSARLMVGGNLELTSYSDFNITGDSQVHVTSNYYQDATSRLAFHIPPVGTDITNLVVEGTATFASNSTIIVKDSTAGGWETNEFEQVVLSSSGLFFGDGTNAASTELLADTNLIHFVNGLMEIDGIVTNESIVLLIERLSIAEGANLIGTSLEPVADEIDDLAQGGNTNAHTMREILADLGTDAQRNKAMHDYYGETESSAPAHNLINHGLQSVSEQLTMRADNTRARMTAKAAAPAGASGPHEPEQELQGWYTAFNSWVDHDADSGFHAYDGNIGGFMIGVDLSVAENVLFGFAGGKSSGDVDKDNGANTETETTYGSVYLSTGTRDWFIDASIIYGSSSIDQLLGTTFDTTAEYDAKNYALYLGIGKEIIGNYLILTPQASILANYYDQDAYTEEASNAVGREVDSFDQFYFQSTLGINIGMYMGLGEMTLKPELRAHWLHEFNANEESVPYSLIGGTGTYNMLLQAPEEDILKIGAGMSTKLGEYLEVRADLDTRQSANYSDYTLLGSLRYQF